MTLELKVLDDCLFLYNVVFNIISDIIHLSRLVEPVNGERDIVVATVYIGLCVRICPDQNFDIYTPEYFLDILESAYLSACLFRVSICVQNTTFCESAGGGIKSHSVTAVVIYGLM